MAVEIQPFTRWSSHTICTPSVVLRTALTVAGPLRIRHVSLHDFTPLFRPPTHLFAACPFSRLKFSGDGFNRDTELDMDRPAGFDDTFCLLGRGGERPAYLRCPPCSRFSSRRGGFLLKALSGWEKLLASLCPGEPGDFDQSTEVTAVSAGPSG
jgi:hypothetical protein